MTSTQQHVYFVSDIHLGLDSEYSSNQRERLIVSWFNEIRSTAKTIYLVGDVFDYWFEYKYVVPKGYIRLLGALTSLVEEGIQVHYFKGNHDMWIFDYFQQEIGITIHNDFLCEVIDGKTFYVTHGDGLGPGDRKYKLIKGILRNKLAQRLFAMIHPSLGLPLMKWMSDRSRKKELRLGPDIQQSNTIQFANDLTTSQHIDYFICGHMHFPKQVLLDNKVAQYVNLGDWVNHFTYAKWDGQQLTLEKYETD